MTGTKMKVSIEAEIDLDKIDNKIAREFLKDENFIDDVVVDQMVASLDQLSYKLANAEWKMLGVQALSDAYTAIARAFEKASIKISQ